MLAYACNSSTQKSEAGEMLQAQSQQISSLTKASQVYRTRLYLINLNILIMNSVRLYLIVVLNYIDK